MFSYSPPKNIETTLNPWRCASFPSSWDLFISIVFTRIITHIWRQICLNIWTETDTDTQQCKAAATSHRLRFVTEYEHVQVTVKSRRIMYFHVPTPRWNISACTFNDERVSSLLLANQSESHAYIHICRDVRWELSQLAFPAGILQVLGVTLIFFIAGCRRCCSLRQSRKNKLRFSFPLTTYWVYSNHRAAGHSSVLSIWLTHHLHITFTLIAVSMVISQTGLWELLLFSWRALHLLCCFTHLQHAVEWEGAAA